MPGASRHCKRQRILPVGLEGRFIRPDLLGPAQTLEGIIQGLGSWEVRSLGAIVEDVSHSGRRRTPTYYLCGSPRSSGSGLYVERVWAPELDSLYILHHIVTFNAHLSSARGGVLTPI